MLNQSKAYRLMPWAWSVAWMLTGLGVAISDLYSYPSKSLIPYIVLSAVGWGFAGFVTVRAAGHKSGATLRLIAWIVAYLVYVVFGFYDATSWNMGFLGPIVAIGVAGAIGGVFSSRRAGAWRLVSGVLVGLTFLLFATVSFYVTAIQMYLFSAEARVLGEQGTLLFIWGLPGAVFGLSAGFVVRWMLGITAVGPTSDPTLD